MDNFKIVTLKELEDLQKLSKKTYIEAFSELIEKDDIYKFIDDKYSIDNLTKDLNDELNHFLFYVDKGLVCGYIMYSIKSDSVEINRLYMLKQFKGLGIGTKLMDKGAMEARKNHKKKLSLGVLEKNVKALSFYQKKDSTYMKQKKY
ncbi:MAG: GNAT family N-acetyltransferase [Streptococcaceae bacterium]|jgi:ribosomal protein S18 acetylase RimI-like enzyme|nr:GNAT family N-acetyltransferase [Streptococcaceae bacterium]MCH4178192.1 GNAT family N-acetyltransferase [Streptococcaceae bacterium]